MPTFSELSASLDKALKEVLSKRSLLESTKEAHVKASTEYDVAVANAVSIRTQLTNELNNMIPSEGSNKPKIG